ncbi:MAG: hypothetical protein WD070_10930 [Pirellulaceae bacterium]
MWCGSCQQDVPAIGSTDKSAARCARCHTEFPRTSEATPPNALNNVPPIGSLRAEAAWKTDWLEKALLEDWELDDELNNAHQLVTSLGVGEPADSTVRFDGSHLPDVNQQSRSERNSRTHQRHTPATCSLFAWCLSSLGLLAFALGAVLVGWSLVEDRPDFWRLGWPFTFGGQAALIVGLAIQLGSLWRSNREAIRTLDELDSQLDELRRATSLLSTTHSSPARTFYRHMAEGASPNLLLADLKGQLDLLANQFANKR